MATPVTNETLAALYVIKTHYIMRVIEFHPETQTVDLVQDVLEYTNYPYGDYTVCNEFGNSVVVTVKSPDMLYGIPVKQERWGQFHIQACPQPGDTGYIEVFTNDIREWMQKGAESLPWTDNHFDKKSCVFVPFIPNAKNAAEVYPQDGTQLIIKSNNASIVITDKPAEEGSEEEPVVDITTTAKTLNINAENGLMITGNISANGDISVKGKLEVDGEINATGDIVAGKGGAKEVSVLDHTHNVPGAGLVAPSGGGTVTGTATSTEPQ